MYDVQQICQHWISFVHDCSEQKSAVEMDEQMLLQASISAAVSNDVQLTGWSTRASPGCSRLVSKYTARSRQ